MGWPQASPPLHVRLSTKGMESDRSVPGWRRGTPLRARSPRRCASRDVRLRPAAGGGGGLPRVCAPRLQRAPVALKVQVDDVGDLGHRAALRAPQARGLHAQQALRSSLGAPGPRSPAAPEHERADSAEARAGAGSTVRNACTANTTHAALILIGEKLTSMAVRDKSMLTSLKACRRRRHLGEGAEVDDAAHGLDAQRLAVPALQAEAPVQAGLLHNTASVQWSAGVARARATSSSGSRDVSHAHARQRSPMQPWGRRKMSCSGGMVAHSQSGLAQGWRERARTASA